MPGVCILLLYTIIHIEQPSCGTEPCEIVPLSGVTDCSRRIGLTAALVGYCFSKAFHYIHKFVSKVALKHVP